MGSRLCGNDEGVGTPPQILRGPPARVRMTVAKVDLGCVGVIRGRTYVCCGQGGWLYVCPYGTGSCVASEVEWVLFSRQRQRWGLRTFLDSGFRRKDGMATCAATITGENSAALAGEGRSFVIGAT